ncbi:MAG: gamma-glutamylcyclotransferase [Pseudomonadota bacterium]
MISMRMKASVNEEVEGQKLEGKARFLSCFDQDRPVWVLAYGSLLWNPGFAVASRCQVRVVGWHRSFCLYSYCYRGSKDYPGLVLGLDCGGHVESLALEIQAKQAHDAMGYLWDREMITHAYIPCVVPATTKDGTIIRCHTFVIDQGHEQYAGRLSKAERLALIRIAHGSGGSNVEYVLRTRKILDKYGIYDPELVEIATTLEMELSAK